MVTPSGKLGDLTTGQWKCHCSSSKKQHFSLKAGSHAGADSVQAGGGSVQGAERRLGAAGEARRGVGGKREFRCAASSFPVTSLLLPDAVRRNVCQKQSLRVHFLWYFVGFGILVDFGNCGKNKTAINFRDLVRAEDRGGSLVRTLCDGWPGRIVGALPKSSWIHPTCPFGEKSKVFGKRRPNLDGGWTNVLANLLAQVVFFIFFPAS